MKPILNQTHTILENFIVLEGLDGSGTTTQLEMLEERFKTLTIPFFSTFEPTKSGTGELIREILKGKKKVHPDTIAFLFAADRNEHLHAPTDQENKWNGQVIYSLVSEIQFL